jgi:hypothetical protein
MIPTPTFSPHFPEAPKSEWLLLPKRESAFWEGTQGVRAEPRKQRTRSCRAQELARSSAQEMCGAKR